MFPSAFMRFREASGKANAQLAWAIFLRTESIPSNSQRSIVSRCFQGRSLGRLAYVSLYQILAKRLRFPDFFYKLGSEDRHPNVKSRTIHENLWQNLWPSAVCLLWHLLTSFAFRFGHGLVCQTRLARSTTEHFKSDESQPLANNGKEWQTWSLFLTEVLFSMTHLMFSSGRIDEEVENLYSTWELLSAEALRLSMPFQDVSRMFPGFQDLKKSWKIFRRPKLVRFGPCQMCCLHWITVITL